MSDPDVPKPRDTSGTQIIVAADGLGSISKVGEGFFLLIGRDAPGELGWSLTIHATAASLRQAHEMELKDITERAAGRWLDHAQRHLDQHLLHR